MRIMVGVRAPSTGAGAGPTPGPAPARRAARLALVARAFLPLALMACVGPPRASDVVVMASGSDLESANPLVTVHPLSRQVQRFVLLVTLARYDEEMEPEPYLARAWEWSEGGRTLTLRLHSGLRWHDGRPTTARDAAFTLDAARDPATGYPRQADLAGITGVAAPDDSTLVVHFREAQARFPTVLCELPLVPAHILAGAARADMRRAAFGTRPVGNGPFRFVSRAPGRRWVFERDPDFPPELGGPPAIRRLVVAVVDESTTKFAGLVSGELDVAGIAPIMAELVARDPALRVLTYPVLFSTGMVFNGHRPPFDDVRVRRAVSASLRRDRIVAAAVAGLAEPATGPVPSASALALDTIAPFDPVAADSLLEGAGWERGTDGWRARNGVPLAFTLVTVGSSDNPVEQLIQDDMAARGIRMRIQQLELGAFLALARAPVKDFDALITGVPGDPSLAYLVAMYGSEAKGGALDYAGFHSVTLDSLLARAASSQDGEPRARAWREVQRQLLRDAPATWIYHSRGVQGISRRLHGVSMDLRGELASIGRWSVDTAATSGADSPVGLRP